MGTDRRYTGQREETGLGSLYDYGARLYSPVIGRFLSADTLVPSASDPQQLNRYAYARGNPVRYTDPTGHYIFEEDPDEGLVYDADRVQRHFGVRVRLRESDDSWRRDAGHRTSDAEFVGTFLGVPLIALLGAFLPADIAASPGAAVLGVGSYTVANGTVSWAKTGDISHFFDEWDPVDAGLSALGGGLIANVPAKLMPLILGGQSAVSDVLHGEYPNALKALANSGLGVVSAKLSGDLGEAFDPVKSRLSESMAGAIDGFGSVTVDTAVSLAVAAVEDLPRQFGAFFVNLIRPVCLYTCR